MVVAILGGSETGMEAWNSTDGSVQLIFESHPEEIVPDGLYRTRLIPIKGSHLKKPFESIYLITV